MPCESTAAALVVDEAVIERALRGDQPAERERWIVDLVGSLKPGAGLGDVACDVELPAGEQRLQGSAHIERQSPDGCDDIEPLELHVLPRSEERRVGKDGRDRG